MRCLQRWRSRTLRTNPIKFKNLEKKLKYLVSLGLDSDNTKILFDDLSNRYIDASQADYVLDWWRARLSLIAFLATEDPKIQNPLLNYLQNYCREYRLSPYDLALDGELAVEIYAEFRHFIELAIANPYFRNPWPTLHWVSFKDHRYHRQAPETHRWLGQIIRRDVKLTGYRYGFSSDSPAIVILRGAYMADPVGQEANTEVPTEAIEWIEETGKPSDLIKFLKDAEEHLQTARYFIPKTHQPFITFEDGKAWVIIDSRDVDAEASSLSDCGRGQYSSDNIILISLREPVTEKYYKALLKAEIVFPNEVDTKTYQGISQSLGVINQLRGYANSKPSLDLHRYIIPLLQQPWVAQIVTPNHRPKETFQLADLPQEAADQLQKVNPKLFDPSSFYHQFRVLEYPSYLRDQIIDRMSFPVPVVIEILTKATRTGLESPETVESKILESSLKRYLKKEGSLEAEAYPLLLAAEEAIFRLQTASGTQRLIEAGAELSSPKIEMILEAILAQMQKFLDDPSIVSWSERDCLNAAKDTLAWDWKPTLAEGESAIPDPEIFKTLVNSAMISLARKANRQESVENLLFLAGKILMAYGRILERTKAEVPAYSKEVKASTRRRRRRPIVTHHSQWPPKSELINWILNAPLGLDTNQIAKTLEYFIELSTQDPSWFRQLTTPEQYWWQLLLHSLGLIEVSPTLIPLIKKLLLHPELSYEPARDLLVRITESGEEAPSPLRQLALTDEEIAEALRHGTEGATHTALLAIKIKLDQKQNLSRKVQNAIRDFLYQIKSVGMAERASETLDFPVRNLIEILETPKISRIVRVTALMALKKRLQGGNLASQKRIYRAVESLLLQTNDKNLMRRVLDLFKGFQHQYILFQKFLQDRIKWASAPENRNFFLGLIRDNLPETKMAESVGFKALPKDLFQFLQGLVSDDLIEDNCEFLLTILFEVRFDPQSQVSLTRLTETVLAAVIANPKKLTGTFCHWIENEPGGWGSTSQRRFTNQLNLTSKLRSQFTKLTQLSYQTGKTCPLELVLAIAAAMSKEDRIKLGPIMMVWLTGILREHEDYPQKYRVEQRIKKLFGWSR